MNSNYAGAKETLAMIQENVSYCFIPYTRTLRVD